MELLQTLIEQLGVSEQQAKGGAGLLFKLAKDKLGMDEFAKVSAAVPGLEGLVASVPEAGGFKNLNLDAGIVGKFVAVILAFVHANGGDAIKRFWKKPCSNWPPRIPHKSLQKTI